ncbi:MAG: FAD-dependent thymidylate synthase [Candidatus Eiseniibacteriota bacterium]
MTDLESILGKKFDVLDDGFVRLIDTMGNDASVVQAARVSYGAGTKQLSDDRKLIRYLMRHQHTTPFEMCEAKFHVRVPMDIWRQWIRHRTANVNEYSTRYSLAIDATHRTSPDQWRTQSAESKQGSAGNLPVDVGEGLSRKEGEIQEASRAAYEERIAAGVAREQARKDLPLSTYTEAYWKIDLHNLLNFLYLRLAPTAQTEIRQYAWVLGNEITRRWCPMVWEAFVDYRLGALTFSAIEIRVVAALVKGDQDAANAVAREAGWIGDAGAPLKQNRERREFEERLGKLGLSAPWQLGKDQKAHV